MLIHEINHAMELSLISYEDDSPVYKCGFETLTDDDDEMRPYEQTSEVVNQLIAMEIATKMHESGVYLFNTPENAKIKGGTSYEQQRIFIEKFWITFKKTIMKSRVLNNLNELFEIVGKENFDRINSIVTKYRKLPYYQMMDDIINKRTTSLTIRRQELFNEANKICDEMLLYSSMSIDDSEVRRSY